MSEICKTGTRWNGKRCISRRALEKRGKQLGKMMEDERRRDHTGLHESWWEIPFPKIVRGLRNRKLTTDVFTKEFFRRRFNREPHYDPIYYDEWKYRIAGERLCTMDGESLAVIEEMVEEGCC